MSPERVLGSGPGHKEGVYRGRGGGTSRDGSPTFTKSDLPVVELLRHLETRIPLPPVTVDTPPKGCGPRRNASNGKVGGFRTPFTSRQRSRVSHSFDSGSFPVTEQAPLLRRGRLFGHRPPLRPHLPDRVLVLPPTRRYSRTRGVSRHVSGHVDDCPSTLPNVSVATTISTSLSESLHTIERVSVCRETFSR